ncbi:hypothetical protein NQ315_003042 [Exocentrus adspersus]|uniref:glucose-6-phosphate 1-epimerase n=1 Tax=Exocentrus adspersus TaxID=1586481 RepID=A0AAV8W4T7_9CUCU|nr:hypothetical protein NQ315_003042 [Exocentrus adspersus]
MNQHNKVVVLDRGGYTTCTVDLQGATVTSWRLHNEEQLFVTRQSFSQSSSYVRGGIHLIFPHLGLWSFGPREGFARTLLWVLEEGPDTNDTSDVYAVFSLSHDSYIQALWGYRFKLLYKIVLCENKLVFRIGVQNLCVDTPFQFHIMLSSLFRVPDVGKCEVAGLQTYVYKDAEKAGAYIENKKTVTIPERANKVYIDVNHDVSITNIMDGNTLRIQRRNHADLSLWNPGDAPSPEIPDLGDGESKYLFGVKAGTLTRRLHLEPLCSWETSHSFEIVEQSKDKKMIQEITDFLSGFC